MNKTLKLSLTLLLSLAAIACASLTQQVVSMRGADVPTPDQAPQDLVYVGKKPGQHDLIARGFKQDPPLIPHSVEGYEEITASQNACLDCHISDEFRGKKMPKVGESHLLKAANAQSEPTLNMLRWQCNSCHVPQTDAKPLVENLFKASATL